MLRLILSTVIAGALLTGCAANRYAAPIGKFRDRTHSTIGVLGEFYDSRNDYELDLYLNSVASDKTQKLQGTDASGQATPLGKPAFSSAAVKARLDALDLVGVYANRLAELAGSPAPARFDDAAALLGTNLASLDTTFKTLAGEKDPTANQFVGPIGNLIGIIGQKLLERKRDQFITEAVHEATPEVRVILNQVKNDMDKIFAPLTEAGEAERLSDLVRAYNTDVGQLSFEQRQDRMKQIKAARKSRSVAMASVPSSLVTHMMEAHEAVVRLAEAKSRKVQDFSAFNDALDMWTTQIQRAAAQIKALIA